MAAYASAILRDLRMGPPIVEYLQRIDATLVPFQGHFIVHGTEPVSLEGPSPGTVVIIEFPDLDHARRWYESDEYQAILPLRTENSSSTAFLLDGVGSDYRATEVLRRTRTT